MKVRAKFLTMLCVRYPAKKLGPQYNVGDKWGSIPTSDSFNIIKG